MAQEKQEDDIPFRPYFLPFTTTKALHFIILIGLVIFLNGLFNGFVSDDNTFVLNNSNIQSFNNITRIFVENRYDTQGQIFLGGIYYRPITELWFLIHYNLYGLNAFPFHLFQILLFITNACLLFFAYNHFFRKSIAFALALLFLLHPINSENAFYIASVQETLFFFFGIISLLLVMKLDSQKAQVIANISLLLSLFSKETGILFVGIILLYISIYKRKILLSFLGYAIVMLFIYGIMRLVALGNPMQISSHNPIERLTLLERLINIPEIIFYYIKTFLFPYNLATSYQWTYTTITFEHFYLPLICTVFFFMAIFSVGFTIYKKKVKQLTALFVFFYIWFLIGLTLHLQIFPLDQTVAERWFYFPIVGLLGIIGILLEIKKFRLTNIYFIIIFIILLTAFSTRIVMRSFDFRNDSSLVRSDMQSSKDSYSLEYILSGVYLNEGNYNAAKIHGERSVALFPNISNYNNLGVIYVNLGEYELAYKTFLKALEYGEDSGPYQNIANISLAYGDYRKNIKFIREEGLKKYPNDGKLWFNLAVLEYAYGDKMKAKEAIINARKYNSDPNVVFIYEIIMNDKQLKISIEHGQVTFNTE